MILDCCKMKGGFFINDLNFSLFLIGLLKTYLTTFKMICVIFQAWKHQSPLWKRALWTFILGKSRSFAIAQGWLWDKSDLSQHKKLRNKHNWFLRPWGKSGIGRVMLILFKSRRCLFVLINKLEGPNKKKGWRFSHCCDYTAWSFCKFFRMDCDIRSLLTKSGPSRAGDHVRGVAITTCI